MPNAFLTSGGTITVQKLYLGCATAALATLTSACGGGGGVGVASTPPPPPIQSVSIPKPVTTPTTETFDTDEYYYSDAAKNSNVLPAWQAGATGRGIKIGIVDSGIDVDHHDFVGRIDPASRDFGGTGTIQDVSSHGTAIASIAAAAHDGRTMEGIAYEATLVIMNIAPRACQPDAVCNYGYDDIASGIRAASNAGARVINLSIGGGSTPGYVTDAVREAARSGVIFVVSAGNESGSRPTGFALDIANAAPGQTIVVGALGLLSYEPGHAGEIDFNQLRSDSNAAGPTLQDWYVGAPGQYLHADYPGRPDALAVLSGTSFAAPVVAGSLALMLQAFPNLSPRDVVNILLSTADDLGAAGVDQEYGHGRLNIGRAFQPIGQTQLAGSRTSVSLDKNGTVPAAAGDALSKGSLRAIVLDAYHRAFSLNLARTLQQAPSARPLAAAVSFGLKSSSVSIGPTSLGVQLTDGDILRKLGFVPSDVGPRGQQANLYGATLVSRLGNGFTTTMSFSGSAARTLGDDDDEDEAFLINQGAVSARAFSRANAKQVSLRKAFDWLAVQASYEKGQVWSADDFYGDARYRVAAIGFGANIGHGRLSLGATRLEEAITVLGGRLGSAFGSPGATSLFIDAKVNAPIGTGWSASGSVRRGWTQFAAGRFMTAGYSLNLTKTGLWRPSDKFTLLLSQPLRVERGGFNLDLPASYDYSTASPNVERTRMSLAPRGREIVAEAGLERMLATGLIGFNAFARRQPGHYATAKPDLGAAVHWKLAL